MTMGPATGRPTSSAARRRRRSRDRAPFLRAVPRVASGLRDAQRPAPVHADAHDGEADELDRLGLLRVAVGPPIALVERPSGPHAGSRPGPRPTEVDAQRPRLADVAGVDPAPQPAVGARDAVGGRRLSLTSPPRPADPGSPRRPPLTTRSRGRIPGAPVLVAEVGDEHPQRRQHARVGGDDRERDVQLGRQAVGVSGPAPPKASSVKSRGS